MLYASGVEPRFPFLDAELADFVRTIPPDLHIVGGTEKHLLRRVAERDLPAPIRKRPKYGFRAPSAAEFLCDERVRAWLAPERIRRDGWFDPGAVAALIADAEGRGSATHPHADDDMLMLVLSFGIFLDLFAAAGVRMSREFAHDLS
jgi:asparagine synthase (glutamine-hydrolysing)